MPTPSQKPTLLIITSETSEAERLMAVLREARLAERSLSIPSADHLDKVIAERSCDLILCCGYDRDVEVDKVLSAYKRLKTDVPLILLAEPEHWEADAGKARRAGARDIVRRADPEHLRLSVTREIADWNARRAAEALNGRLAQCEQSTLRLTEITGAGVAFVQDGLHIDVSATYARLFGQSATEDVLSMPLLDLIAAEHHQAIRDLLKSTDLSDSSTTRLLDVTCQRVDASRFEARLLASPSEFEGEPCLRLILQPIETAPAQVSAAPDAISATQGAAGMAALIAEIETHIDEQRLVTRPFAIFFIRVEKILDVMHDMGLSLGLELLDEFGGTLSALVGERGFLTRVSEDGFGLIVDGLDELGAQTLAAELSAQARLPVRAAVQDTTVPDCQIGYFLVRDRASAPEDIINTAHRLCIGHRYDSDGVNEQEHSLTKGEDEEAAIAHKIEYALRNDQLKLVYQPIISLMGDNQENYSVLLRLLDEDENLLEAKDFIGTATRCGLIEALDKWTIRSAIEVIGKQRRAGHNLSLFVALSEDTFKNPNTLLWICDCLREFDVRGNWLTIQFQEDVVVGNLASISKLVETLRKIKCRVAISRFGATERPEMLLQALSLDFVLLRPALAQGLADDAAKQQRLLQLATLAREFNVKSVVTGVEDARALTVLWTAGVDYVQGNFLQRPSPTLEVQA
ncbi:EAL domain-containing protein [Allochromatium palmeri]|uniref:EAL domain-containing protein n=1 Tax=Allochromatium palmeri TaxID=231048 RepID=A0A6N8EFC0_9GAMM|nr:EAL domain-containing protein [Allochromatium palmeri]MTW21237.1 EAL domain-containing protein [Allochromatium palmeri]